MLCAKCGYEISDQAEYCPYCGSAVRGSAKNASQSSHAGNPGGAAYESQPYAQRRRPQPAVVSIEDLPPEYKPMSAWAYVGWGILFMLPIAGLILVIVFSCVSGNVNRKRYARSFLCWLLIAAVVLAILLLAGVITWNGLLHARYFNIVLH